MPYICSFRQVADYDKEGSVLRIRGKNILENEHVKVIIIPHASPIDGGTLRVLI